MRALTLFGRGTVSAELSAQSMPASMVAQGFGKVSPGNSIK